MTSLAVWNDLPPMILRHCRLALASSEDVTTVFADDPEQYLTPRERQTWKAINDRNYRRDWFAGRMMVKKIFDSLKANPLEIPSESERFRQYEVVSRNADGRGIRPQLTVAGVASPRTISIAHAGGMVCVGVALLPGTMFGLDITPQNGVSSSVVRSYFTDSEKKLLGKTTEFFFPERLWCAKEAVYKALCTGEPFMPRLFQPIAQCEDYLVYGYRQQNEEKQALVFSGCRGSVAYAIAIVGVESS